MENGAFSTFNGKKDRTRTDGRQGSKALELDMPTTQPLIHQCFTASGSFVVGPARGQGGANVVKDTPPSEVSFSSEPSGLESSRQYFVIDP